MKIVDFISVEDYDLCFKSSFKKRILAFCREILGEHRIHSNNPSNNSDLHYNNLKTIVDARLKFKNFQTIINCGS